MISSLTWYDLEIRTPATAATVPGRGQPETRQVDVSDLTSVRAGDCERPTPKYSNGRTGTVAGFQAHTGAGEVSCQPCRDAWNANVTLKRDPVRRAAQRLFLAWGITAEQYSAMLAAQGGGCAICGATEPGGNRARFVVDHDHACCPAEGKACGKCTRGLLCNGCNVAVGIMQDDPARLRAAADYVARLR